MHPWRDPAVEFPPCVPCDDPTIACGIPNPFAPEAVRARLEELHTSSRWKELEGGRAEAPEAE